MKTFYIKLIITSAMLSILGVSSFAAESRRCEKIFSSEDIVTELAKLRVDSETNEKLQMRKTIYAQYEKKFALAQKAQLDLSNLAQRIDEIRNEKYLEQKAAQETRENIKESEENLGLVRWNPDKKIENHDRESRLAMNPLNSDFATYTKHKSVIHIYSRDGVTINKISFYDKTSYEIKSIAFSPDGKSLLVSPSGSTEMILFDYLTGFEIRRISNPLEHIVFSPQGNQVAGTDGQYHVFVVDINTGQRIRELELYRQMPLFKRSDLAMVVKFSPDGESLFVIGTHGYFARLNLKTGQVEFLGNQNADFVSADISPDGKYIITGSNDGLVICWDVETKTILYKLPVGPSTNALNYVPAIRFSPDGTQFATATREGTVQIWWTKYGSQAAKLVNPVYQGPQKAGKLEDFIDVNFSIDGKRIFAPEYNGFLNIWKKEEEHE
jgi:WD40 repeat protein